MAPEQQGCMSDDGNRGSHSSLVTLQHPLQGGTEGVAVPCLAVGECLCCCCPAVHVSVVPVFVTHLLLLHVLHVLYAYTSVLRVVCCTSCCVF